MANGADLSHRISLHYTDQLFYQVHRLIGSADILGNPVGLFSNLSSGVAELFYEPWQGLIMSDRPQDLGIGIAKVKHIVCYNQVINPYLNRALVVSFRRVCLVCPIVLQSSQAVSVKV
jgi:hypothetical protein